MTEYNLALVKLERVCSTQFSLPLLVLILTVADEYPVRMFSDPLLVHSSDVQQFHDMNDTICIFHPVVVYEYPVQTESHTANGCGNFRIHLFSAVIQGTLKKFWAIVNSQQFKTILICNFLCSRYITVILKQRKLKLSSPEIHFITHITFFIIRKQLKTVMAWWWQGAGRWYSIKKDNWVQSIEDLGHILKIIIYKTHKYTTNMYTSENLKPMYMYNITKPHPEKGK